MPTPNTAEKKPTREEILTNLRDLISEQLGMGFHEVTSASHLVEDLGADSLDLVELTLAIEETFDIEIPEEAEEQVMQTTVERLLDFIETRVQAS